MHGPAVTSLLAGKEIGVAPDARIYYAAAPSWLADAAYFAEALDWIVEENRKLPAGRKIRVVSVSAAPSGAGSPFTKNNALWDEAVARAEMEGLVVLDCTRNHGWIGSCWFTSGDREDPARCAPGFPGREPGPGMPDRVLVPTSPRTTAEEYTKGQFGYQYTGRGGLSWAIPYASGVLALGWQERPELSGKEMIDLLQRSAYNRNANTRVINPRAFLRLVKAYSR
jgi:hypothetical protein